MSSSTENDKTIASCEFDENMEAFRGLSFFSGMPMDVLKALAYFCKRVNYPQGEAVFSQGELDDRAYYIFDGEAELVREGEGGSENVIGTFQPGEFLGALALLADAKRLFTLRAKSPLTVMVLPRKKFMTTVVDGQGTALAFLEAVTRRIILWEETFLEEATCGDRSLSDTGVSLI